MRRDEQRMGATGGRGEPTSRRVGPAWMLRGPSGRARPTRQRPSLRLADRLPAGLSPSGRRGPAIGVPLTGPTDPRWVMSVRTAEQLQGAILSPERREKLRKLGKLLGLTPFSVSLIIAIVQDQARRGYAPQDCPTAGEPQLRMVPLSRVADRHGLSLRVSLAVAFLLAVELLVIWWFLPAL